MTLRQLFWCTSAQSPGAGHYSQPDFEYPCGETSGTEDGFRKGFEVAENIICENVDVKGDGLVEVFYSTTSSDGERKGFGTTFEYNDVPDQSLQDLARQGLKEYVSQIEEIQTLMEEQAASIWG